MRTKRRSLADLSTSDISAIVLKSLKRLRSTDLDTLVKTISTGSILAEKADDLRAAVVSAIATLVKDGTATDNGNTVAAVIGKRGRPAKVKDAPVAKAAAQRQTRKPKAKVAAKRTAKGKPGRKRLFSGLPPVSSYEA